MAGGTDPRQIFYDAVWHEQTMALGEVVSACLQAGLTPILFKGAELVPRRYGRHGLGLAGDVDLLLPRTEMEEAKAVLHGLGYRQAVRDPQAQRLVARDVAALAAAEADHYELAAFVKLVDLDGRWAAEAAVDPSGDGPVYPTATGAQLLVQIDVHHGVAGDVDSAPLIRRAVPSRAHPGALTLCDADHLWLNLSRNYIETAIFDRTSLRPLAYTLPVLVDGAVDWSVVAGVAEELSLGHTLHYHLDFAGRLCPGRVPEWVLDRVAGSARGRLRDFGWQLAKPFGFDEPFPARLLGLE